MSRCYCHKMIERGRKALQHAAEVGVAAVYSVHPEIDHPLTDLPVHPLPTSQPRRGLLNCQCLVIGLHATLSATVFHYWN